MAATREPKRTLTPEQSRAMLLREAVVLEERGRGRSFYKIERAHPAAPHRNIEGKNCHCGGLSNPDRIWRRAIARAENVGWRRAEAIRLEEQRLDDLQDGVWDRAMGGDPKAVEVALKVLERRARMLGLDFADFVTGKLVEVEEAKVRLMAEALAKALRAADLPDEARRAATTAFFSELRAAESSDGEVFEVTGLLSPEDRSLL